MIWVELGSVTSFWIEVQVRFRPFGIDSFEWSFEQDEKKVHFPEEATSQKFKVPSDEESE